MPPLSDNKSNADILYRRSDIILTVGVYEFELYRLKDCKVILKNKKKDNTVALNTMSRHRVKCAKFKLTYYKNMRT